VTGSLGLTAFGGPSLQAHRSCLRQICFALPSQILHSADLFRPTIGLEFGLVDRFANGSDLFLGQLNLAGLRIGDGLVGIASADQRV
jgi:hypothetical protein